MIYEPQYYECEAEDHCYVQLRWEVHQQNIKRGHSDPLGGGMDEETPLQRRRYRTVSGAH